MLAVARRAARAAAQSRRFHSSPAAGAGHGHGGYVRTEIEVKYFQFCFGQRHCIFLFLSELVVFISPVSFSGGLHSRTQHVQPAVYEKPQAEVRSWCFYCRGSGGRHPFGELPQQFQLSLMLVPCAVRI